MYNNQCEYVNLIGSSKMNGNNSPSPENVLQQQQQQQQLPQALQNLQRILQSQLANVNPLHLQQAIQRQQVFNFNSFQSFFTIGNTESLGFGSLIVFYYSIISALGVECKNIQFKYSFTRNYIFLQVTRNKQSFKPGFTYTHPSFMFQPAKIFVLVVVYM